MKRVRMVLQVMVLFVFGVSLLVGATAHAAAPDAGVKGLWVAAPAFPTNPKEVDVLEFEDDPEYNVVTYKRLLDGSVVFEIRRQTIEESELRTPDDVLGLIEMRVNNEDIDEKIIKERIANILVDTEISDLSKRLTYPCAIATYLTGSTDDTYVNIALFIFTDIYSFAVEISMPIKSFKDYAEASKKWLASVTFVEGKE